MCGLAAGAAGGAGRTWFHAPGLGCMRGNDE
jgi:hypothetical protein